VLREQIRELLLERILKGGLQPRDRLVELQIGQELGARHEPGAGVGGAEGGSPEKAGGALRQRAPAALRQHFETLRTMMKRGVNV
jgi:DNA-binding GntR family transcriptional regulator